MTSLSISGSSGSEGVTSGPVRKPDAKGGVANLSPMAIEKDKDLSLIDLWTRQAERSEDAFQKAVAGRQWNGEGQYR